MGLKNGVPLHPLANHNVPSWNCIVWVVNPWRTHRPRSGSPSVWLLTPCASKVLPVSPCARTTASLPYKPSSLGYCTPMTMEISSNMVNSGGSW